MDALKPCPKCEGINIELVQVDCEDREGTPKAFQCLNCGWIAACGYFPSEIEDIIYNWNHGIINDDS